MTDPGERSIDDFDLANAPADFIDNPYPYYDALRTRDPMHRCRDGAWLLTRHEDCLAVYRSTAMSSDKAALFTPKFGATPLRDHHTTSLVFNDPPYHTRVRATLVEALKPRAIQATVAVLENVVSRLLDALAHQRTFDIIEDYASRIPVEIISSLLTVPDSQRGELRRWSLAILGALEPTLSAAELEAGNRAVTEFIAHLRRLIAYRRHHPAGTDNDVLSGLVAQHDAGELSELELLHNCIFLLNAGHETTTNLIGNGVQCLLTNPLEMEKLAAKPNAIKGAVEEVLRFASPNQLGNREVSATTRIGGVTLHQGGAGHRLHRRRQSRPAVFSAPNEFNIQRTPNHHLAFGSGIHACVGMALARIEGKIALEALFKRFPDLSLTESPVLRRRIRFRGFERLMVSTR